MSGQAGAVLTIGQLAAYAGVTIRTVRHYHQVGLLPEPERDVSGYRSYDAGAVVRLIRIRTLAEAGVPLARVQQLLEADETAFADETARIDRELRDRIRDLQRHRRRIAQLASGDSLAVPDEVADYLDRVRALGVAEAMVEAERDAWILVAARYPDRIDAFMEDKVQQLQDPRTVRFYQLASRLLTDDDGDADRLVHEMADLLVELFEEAADTGRLDQEDLSMDDSAFVKLLDSMAEEHDAVEKLRALLAERGWAGWSVIERA